MRQRVLVPLPDRDFDVTEVAVPWKLLTDAGREVVFATERGAVAAADPRLIHGVIAGQLGAAPEPLRFYREMEHSPAYQAPIRWDAMDAAGYDALVLPGGHAPGMKPYLESARVQETVLAFHRADKVVGAICHGVLVAARTMDPETGRSVLHGRRTTCLPKYLERTAWLLTAWKLGRYYRTYDDYVEDEVRAALAAPTDFVRGPRVLVARGTASDDRAAFVVEDGSFLSGRWPGDAYLFAKRLNERLSEPPKARLDAARPDRTREAVGHV